MIEIVSWKRCAKRLEQLSGGVGGAVEVWRERL